MLLEYFGRPPEGLETKSSRTDPVSDADREAERVIEELLAAERPDDGLLAEEGSRSEARSGRRWIVDPLDGTVNFLYGFPVWGVSVALEDAEGVAVGVVYDPCRDELFRAVRNGGAELDGSPLGVRDRRELRNALVATGFSYDPGRRGAQAELVAELVPRVRDIRRAGAAALDLAWLAAGRLDGFFEHGLKHWDWAAGRLLVEEAGGVSEPLPGDPPGLAAAATPELLAALMEHAGALRPA
ncbi:MAG: inositol monophosphatase [Thermoleophilaceae bacterium]|nr:inositol monophosphatase [Thermoleophilaceae bacterium]